MNVSILVCLTALLFTTKSCDTDDISIANINEFSKAEIVNFFKDNFPEDQLEFLNVTHQQLKEHFESYYDLSERFSRVAFNRSNRDILGVGLAIDVDYFNQLVSPGEINKVVKFFAKCYCNVVKKACRRILVEVNIKSELYLQPTRYNILKEIVEKAYCQLQNNDVLIFIDENVKDMNSLGFEISTCPYKKESPYCDWKNELNMESNYCIFSHRIVR